MKTIKLLIMLLVTSNIIFVQVGIGTTTPNASAVLDLSSTTGGLLMPRMTTAERTAIASPVAGLQVYDTTTNTIWYNNGTAWVNSGTATGNTLYTGDGALTSDRIVAMGSNKLTFTGTKEFRIDGFAGSKSFSMGGSGVFGIDAPSIVNGRFVVLDNGNVGIGTASPTRTLNVIGEVEINTPGAASTTNPLVIVTGNNTANKRLYVNTGAIEIQSNQGSTSTSPIFHINSVGNNMFTVLGNGNVGIGTNAPAGKLDIAGTLAINGNTGTAGQVLTSNGSSAPQWINTNDTSTPTVVNTLVDNSRSLGTTSTFASFTASQKGLYLFVLEGYLKDRVASSNVSFFNVSLNRQVEFYSSSAALFPSISTVQYLESGYTINLREEATCSCFLFSSISSGARFKVYKLFSY